MSTCHSSPESSVAGPNSFPTTTLPISEAGERYLLHHYTDVVTAKLPWIDHPKNPWRTVIIPLAMQSRSLLFALLSMAAKDLALAYSKATGPNDFLEQSERYRDCALRLMATHFADEREANVRCGQNMDTLTPALATTLILCNLEMRSQSSKAWQIHLHASRTLLVSHSTARSVEHHRTRANAFLVEKLFSLHVFSLMSNFDSQQEDLIDILPIQYDSVFVDFLRIMQNITEMERHQRQSRQDGTVKPSKSISEQCLGLYYNLNCARENTLKGSAALNLGSEELRQDLGMVVEMFFYANLIYGHRALLGHCCSDEIEVWRDGIINGWQSLKDVESFSQDLFWPLFIAGTEMHGDVDLQSSFETSINRVLELSGHQNGLEALKFLKRYWKWRAQDARNWIDFALHWKEQGNEFLII